MSKFSDKVVEQSKSFFWAFVFVMFVRTFLYQLFNIPSGSMHPTCLEGDFLLVNKFCYGYSSYSLPLQPKVIEGRIFKKQPKRGDVIVFHNPHHRDPLSGKQEGVEYIKRLVGLPGDKIQVIDGVLHINGKAVKREYVGMYKFESGGRVFILKKWTETFPDGHKHPILEDPDAKEGWHNNTQEIIVKKGHYFCMGDNRDHSMDCRWEKEVGQIPEERLVGRAEIYIFSISAKLAEFWKWPFSIRFDRIMMQIR